MIEAKQYTMAITVKCCNNSLVPAYGHMVHTAVPHIFAILITNDLLLPQLKDWKSISLTQDYKCAQGILSNELSFLATRQQIRLLGIMVTTVWLHMVELRSGKAFTFSGPLSTSVPSSKWHSNSPLDEPNTKKPKPAENACGSIANFIQVVRTFLVGMCRVLTGVFSEDEEVKK